ncbi:hypothetical protein C8C83_3262 [Flavobacterium sp. 90]|uniref:hypothetical protein n=1 Tax=unclassified Flavobacterium TaxID=196869 RepID=UPI000EAF7BD6|nr:MULTISPECIES: hypothetical protein [unclassified Flavobacterium]RKR11525.1 hypothetical protein C8C82_3572 [Flavobacterium sp. 81]TCK55307.1 hypothetical protein C8C83_3262 [Flavobacterium sp. 90]
MKKLILFVAIASLFTIFSCTPDEYETPPTKKTEKIKDSLQAGDKGTEGPGDGTDPTKPPTVIPKPK